jgi:hypothetical protein
MVQVQHTVHMQKGNHYETMAILGRLASHILPASDFRLLLVSAHYFLGFPP